MIIFTLKQKLINELITSLKYKQAYTLINAAANIMAENFRTNNKTKYIRT